MISSRDFPDRVALSFIQLFASPELIIWESMPHGHYSPFVSDKKKQQN